MPPATEPRRTTKLLIVAHAPLASALQAVAAHAYPEQAGRVASLDIGADQPEPERAVRQALEALEALEVSSGQEVLVLTDAFGATPCSACQKAAVGLARVRVLAGVNVPMVWRALNQPDDLPADELSQRAMAGAVQGVMPANPTPRQNQPGNKGGHDPKQHHDQQ